MDQSWNDHRLSVGHVSSCLKSFTSSPGKVLAAFGKSAVWHFPCRCSHRCPFPIPCFINLVQVLILIWEWRSFAVKIFQSKVHETNHLLNSPGVIPSKRSWRRPGEGALVVARNVNLVSKVGLFLYQFSVRMSQSRDPIFRVVEWGKKCINFEKWLLNNLCLNSALNTTHSVVSCDFVFFVAVRWGRFSWLKSATTTTTTQ